jgi:hypothetical protein
MAFFFVDDESEKKLNQIGPHAEKCPNLDVFERPPIAVLIKFRSVIH